MALPHGKNASWPRCRWCHSEIEPIPAELVETTHDDWLHVATGRAQCEGRPNHAEPMPELDEEPFIKHVYEFIGRHRKLRRAFRETSQSRASALRRLNDYHELVDKVIDAHDAIASAGRGGPRMQEREMALQAAIIELRNYRKSTQAAGWR